MTLYITLCEIDFQSQEPLDFSKSSKEPLKSIIGSKEPLVLKTNSIKLMVRKDFRNYWFQILIEATEEAQPLNTHNVWPSNIVQSQNGPSAQTALDSQNGHLVYSSFVQNGPSA